MNTHSIEYTDTMNGETNYSWVRRATVTMPELTHYGYDGATGYARANRIYNRELMRKAKAAMGLQNVRGTVAHYCGIVEFRPYRSATVLFID